jgi:hypothetical protein
MAEILSSEKTNDGDFLVLMRLSPKEFKKIKNNKEVLVFSKEKARFVSSLEEEIVQKLKTLNLYENCLLVTPKTRLRDLELSIIEYLEEMKYYVIYLSCELTYDEFVDIIKFREMVYGDSVNLKNVFFIACNKCSPELKKQYNGRCVVVNDFSNLSDIGLMIEEAIKTLISGPKSKPIVLIIDSWSMILKTNPPSSNEKFARFLQRIMLTYPLIGIFIFKHLEYRDDAMELTNPKFILRV